MMTAIHSFFPFFHIPNLFLNHETKHPSFKSIHNLNELADFLTITSKGNVDIWLESKKEIKKIIQQNKNNLNEIDDLLKKITEKGIEKNPQKMISFISEIFDLEIMNHIAKFHDQSFVNAFDWAADRQSEFPNCPANSLKSRVNSEWKKCRPIILYFIPNLIDVFLKAFNFLDSRKRFTSLFESHLLLDIVYKFFLIPCCLIQLLQPVLGITAKVYAVAVLIIVSVGIFVSCYQRWLRPFPNEIIHCTNLDRKMEMGLIEPKIGQFKISKRFRAALEAGSDILLVGDSGDGKTALMHHLVQLKYQKKLSEKLQKMGFFEVDCSSIISNYSYGHSEIINQIKEQTEGFDDKILLFFDEFYQIATNKEAFLAVKKHFLGDKPRPQFVGAVTEKEFEKIKEIDVDQSFERRVCILKMKTSSKQHNERILKDLIFRVFNDIPVAEDGIEEILKISAKKNFMPGIGQPAKAIKILTDAVGLCRDAYHPNYLSDELDEAREQFLGVKLKAEDKKKLKSLVDQHIENKKQIAKIQIIKKEQQKLFEDYYRLTHLLAKASDNHFNFLFDEQYNGSDRKIKKSGKFTLNHSEKSISKEFQLLYLWYEFYAAKAMKEVFERELNKVSNKIPIQVNKHLISQVYHDYYKDNQEDDDNETVEDDDEGDPIDTVNNDG